MRESNNTANADGLYRNKDGHDFPCDICKAVIGCDHRFAKWAEGTGAPVMRICVPCSEAKSAAAVAEASAGGGAA